MIRRIAAFFITVFLMGLTASAQQDCFALLAGKKATADGSVMLGHNEDNGVDNLAFLHQVERRDHPEGEWVALAGGGRLAQVKTTYGYWILEMPGLEHSNALLNEHGLAIISDSCPSREDRPELTNGGIGGPILRRLVAERAQTAREGVELVGSLIERFGYRASGRTLVLADPNEGWLVAMVNGKHWVAARVPDDEVAVIANTFTIGEIDLNDGQNFLGADDLLEYAAGRGWYNPADGPFNFQKAYAHPGSRRHPSNLFRNWSGLNHVAAEKRDPPTEMTLPFSTQPAQPITVQDFAAALRDHYEDGPENLDNEARRKLPHQTSPSSICCMGTNSSSIFQLRPDMPVGVGALWWCALWGPCSTPYMPLYLGMNKTPGQLTFGSDKTRASAAYGTFRDLSRWVHQDYPARIPGVRACWKAFEEASFSFMPLMEERVLKRWQENEQLAREILTRYCHGSVSSAVGWAKTLQSD